MQGFRAGGELPGRWDFWTDRTRRRVRLFFFVHARFQAAALPAQRQVAPVSVQLIGVPQDVPYDERVYRVTFDVGDLLVTDRCVLMVLSPDGERLTRFHFNLL